MLPRPCLATILSNRGLGRLSCILLSWKSYSRQPARVSLVLSAMRDLNVNTNSTNHVHSTESNGKTSWNSDNWDVDKRAVYPSVSLVFSPNRLVYTLMPKYPASKTPKVNSAKPSVKCWSLPMNGVNGLAAAPAQTSWSDWSMCSILCMWWSAEGVCCLL